MSRLVLLALLASALHAGEFPRTKPGLGGPVGSDTDRGKLVPGSRDPALPPLPVTTPDVPQLPFKMVEGFKEFHLHAEVVKLLQLPE